MRLSRLTGCIALAGLVASACSTRHPEQVSPAPEPGRQQAATAPSSASAAARARYPYTEADVNFMTGMIHHHAQALVMAGWAQSHGASPSVQTLAGRIINGQQDEINSMQRWLRDRNLPVPDPNAMSMSHHDGRMMHMMMPGMLTEAELEDLDQAQGAEFDRKFLTYMIQHHKGAVSMVNDLFATNGAAQDEAVFKFANDVNVDQTTEITRMQRMLDSLPPG